MLLTSGKKSCKIQLNNNNATHGYNEKSISKKKHQNILYPYLSVSLSLYHLSIYLHQLLDSKIEQFYKFALRYSTTFIQF